MSILNKIVEASSKAVQRFPLWRQWFPGQPPAVGQDFMVPLVCYYDDILSTLIHEFPTAEDFQAYGVAQVQYLAAQLKEGVIPSIEDLLDTFPQAASSESRHLLVRYAYFLNRAGEQGRLRSDQLNLALQLRIREKMCEQIEQLCVRYDPSAPEVREYATCVAHLRSIMDEIEQTLLPLLEKDPSHGGTLRIQADPLWPWLRPFSGVLGLLRGLTGPTSGQKTMKLPEASEEKILPLS